MLGTRPVMDRIHFPGIWIQHLTILCVLTLYPCLCDANLTCSPGLEDYGVTYPRGDIFVEEGDPLQILCVLNVNHVDVQQKNASSLYFVRDETEVTADLVRIVNETTIELVDPAPEPSNSIYSCRFRHDDKTEYPRGVGICLNKVSVGFHPSKHPVTNISCISYNWENFTCSWTPPQNFVVTTYQITLYEVGKRNPYYKCPSTTQQENKCTWSHSTEPMYRQAIETYNITLTGSNVFGKDTQYHIINSYENVLPDKPELKVSNKTSNSILLWWKVKFPLETFPPGLIQKVEYQPHWEPRDQWKIADTSSLGVKSVNYTFNLTNLKYANTHYDIRVFMKSASAKGDSLWSEPASVTVKTLPDVPSSPPQTSVGSFEVVQRDHPNHDRDVYVYWQQIPDYGENGDDFEYKVIEIKEAGVFRNIQASVMTKAFAKYERISNNAYEFTIVSSNKIGYSKESSKVFVPSKQMMPLEPLSFTKVAYEQGTYELSWKASNRHDLVDNYTIFWCDNERERPYQCVGMLRWMFVDSKIFVQNITVADSRNYQFAISANSKDGSSGMIWAKCTIIHNKVIGKMNDVWVQKVGSTSIELGWKLDCSGRIGILQGFQIFYCPIINLRNPECTEPQQNTTVGDQSTAIIQNLKPYRTYSISVAVSTISETGAFSDPIYETTLEAAPDQPPLNLRLGNVSNTTAQISWDPPLAEFQNGVIRYYEIRYSSLTYNTSYNETEVLLTDLKSHKVYSVTVSACTKSCSKPSTSLKFKTDIGAPGMIHQPTVKFTNSTQALVSWSPPALKGGNLDFYDVEISDDVDKRNSTKIIRQANSTETVVSCQGGRTKTKDVRVRAVNIGSNTTYYGPWSPIGTVSCIASGISPFTMGLLYVFFFICFTSCVLVIGKKSWYRCAKMKDFDVKLPPSLNAICDDKNKEHECSLPMQNWTGQSRKEENALKTESSADEELLLQKKEINAEQDETVEDSDSKHETFSQGESPAVSTSDNLRSFKSIPKMNESYADKKDHVEASTGKGNSPERDLSYCKVGGGYVSIAPLSGPSSAPQAGAVVVENPYVPNTFETPPVVNYVKAFNIPNASSRYCRIGLGTSDIQPIPDAGTKLLSNPESRYVTVGDSIKLNREPNSVQI